MTFERPLWLWALVVVALLAALLPLVAAGERARLARFVAPAHWALLNPYVALASRRLRGVLLVGALVLAIIAAARPSWGIREQIVRERGIDVIIALDVSRSMLAADTPGGRATRLDVAKGRLRDLLARFPGHRVGIVPFAGDAFLQCPLTTDYNIAFRVLEALQPDTVGAPGTNIGRAIEASLEAFRGGSVGSRVLILVTDGEDHEAGAKKAAEAAAQAGVRIYAIGIGSVEGAPIREAGGKLREDAQGGKILTRLDADTLRAVADATDGLAFVSPQGALLDMRPLAEQLAALERGDLGEDKRLLREERFQWPLALALLLLMVDGLLGDRRSTRADVARAQGAAGNNARTTPAGAGTSRSRVAA